jgi:hypothetical protein
MANASMRKGHAEHPKKAPLQKGAEGLRDMGQPKHMWAGPLQLGRNADQKSLELSVNAGAKMVRGPWAAEESLEARGQRYFSTDPAVRLRAESLPLAAVEAHDLQRVRKDPLRLT